MTTEINDGHPADYDIRLVEYDRLVEEIVSRDGGRRALRRLLLVPCRWCMGTGGVPVPCLDCQGGVPMGGQHDHTCRVCKENKENLRAGVEWAFRHGQDVLIVPVSMLEEAETDI